MLQINRSIMTQRRLLLFKWLMVLIPPVTVAVGHSLLALTVGHSLPGHTLGSLAETLLVTLFVTCLGLVLAYARRVAPNMIVNAAVRGAGLGYALPGTVLALGLIIGGALGNAIDRLAYGAVADFVLLHLETDAWRFNWYVFNLADVAIVAGVAVLLYESLRGERAPKAP